MQLIQIDSVIKMYIGSGYIPQNYPLPVLVFVDAETGVVYFNGMYPRYDANGRVMVIPRDRLPGVIARARTQASAVEEFRVAKKADEERKRTITQV